LLRNLLLLLLLKELALLLLVFLVLQHVLFISTLLVMSALWQPTVLRLCVQGGLHPVMLVVLLW
jgi:hypothetical protein